jgi:hypothetical protein
VCLNTRRIDGGLSFGNRRAEPALVRRCAFELRALRCGGLLELADFTLQAEEMRGGFILGAADDGAVWEQSLPVECGQLTLEAFALQPRSGLQRVDHQHVEQQVAHPGVVCVRVTHQGQQWPHYTRPGGEWRYDARWSTRRAGKKRRSTLLFTCEVVRGAQRCIGVVDEQVL